MPKEQEKERAEVGVIIGRFQLDNLHEGHIGIFEYVLERHDRVIVFLGMSPNKCTMNNTLDFEARKQMLDKEFKGRIEIHYVKAHPISGKSWLL